MNQLLFYVFFLAVVLPQNAQAQTASPYKVCVSKATLVYPKKRQRIIAGGTLLIGVRPTNPRDITFMELYLNGIFIGRDHSYPFLWGRERSSKLRKIQRGIYRLECRIYDRCHTKHSVYMTIEVKPARTLANKGYHPQNQLK